MFVVLVLVYCVVFVIYSLYVDSCGFCFVVYGLWFMVYGSWFMVYGLWFMVYDLWFIVYGTDISEVEVQV